jgi:ferritin-like metal-binding protein YciE
MFESGKKLASARRNRIAGNSRTARLHVGTQDAAADIVYARRSSAQPTTSRATAEYSGAMRIRLRATHLPGDSTMAETGTFHDAFIDELRDTYDAEKQLTKALPKLAKAATNAKLRAAFETHLEETQGQIERLEQVFESLDEKVRGKHCDGIAGIIEEGKSIMEEDFDETTMDACLIAAGQRAEHYEMAAYGTLVAWAQAMGHTEAAKLLQQTLDEEKAADKKLSGLADGGINKGAADAAHAEEHAELVSAGAGSSRKNSGKSGRR